MRASVTCGCQGRGSSAKPRGQALAQSGMQRQQSLGLPLRTGPQHARPGPMPEMIQTQRKGLARQAITQLAQRAQSPLLDLPQEMQGEMQIGRVSRLHARRQVRLLPVGQPTTQRLVRPQGEEQAAAHRRSSSPRRAATTEAARTCSRSPEKCAHTADTPAGVPQASQTVPTGLSGVPPPGPAIPLTAML